MGSTHRVERVNHGWFTPALPLAQDCASEQVAEKPPWVRLALAKHCFARSRTPVAYGLGPGPRAGIHGVSPAVRGLRLHTDAAGSCDEA